ncbi:hypothetical protein [Cytobacillus oceanisediminis]|uniref:hypothetical protein n=1 Tax=Cytobacillus oceanisediminis TaxID=665099 RepID=UPI0020B4053C|nr:hypothetical protein [Cytobacillus oceanisediminis]
MEYRFAQVLHGKLYKRTLFIVLVVLIHINSIFNEVIRLSFHGKIQEAIVLTNYQWLMFYPGLYFFAMWDALKRQAEEEKKTSRNSHLSDQRHL